MAMRKHLICIVIFTVLLFFSCSTSDNSNHVDDDEISDSIVDVDELHDEDLSSDAYSDADKVVDEMRESDVDDVQHDVDEILDEMRDVDSIDEDELFDADDDVDELLDDSQDADVLSLDEDIDEVEDSDFHDSGERAPVTPTNMVKCYDDVEQIVCPSEGSDFYGQDGQYIGSSRLFSVQGDAHNDDVHDSLTGLVWQRSLDEVARNWFEATTYCATLNYADSTEWRVPTIEELSTIADYSIRWPTIDATVFPDTSPSGFWTSTIPGSSTTHAKGLDFNDGYVYEAAKTGGASVRCVRGDSLDVNHHFTVFTLFGDEIVIDSDTGFIWTKEYVIGKKWKDALAYCSTLSYAGESDWRLPDVNELRMLLDYSLYEPSSHFPDEPSVYLWSSTTYVYNPERAWGIDSWHGVVAGELKSGKHTIRCIR